jgi:hypothetical protein
MLARKQHCAFDLQMLSMQSDPSWWSQWLRLSALHALLRVRSFPHLWSMSHRFWLAVSVTRAICPRLRTAGAGGLRAESAAVEQPPQCQLLRQAGRQRNTSSL